MAARTRYPVKIRYTKEVTLEGATTTSSPLPLIAIAHRHLLAFMNERRPWEKHTPHSIEVASTVFTLEELQAYQAEREAHE
jgi:hypothetical protein